MQGVRRAAVRALQAVDNTFAANEKKNTLSAARRLRPVKMGKLFLRDA
jgi:hypothetical protein